MEAPSRKIAIIEPTFESASGHCRAFVAAFCRASIGSGWDVSVWGGRGASLPEFGPDAITVLRHFYRPLRRVQAWFLYRNLLARPGRILVSTAGRIDFTLLDLAARGVIPPYKAYLYIHWVRPTAAREAFFRRVAARQPNLVVLGPTPGVVDLFLRAGFKESRVVPYPEVPGSGDIPKLPFSHILFAGGARKDKGFPAAVDLILRLAADGSDLPVVIQSSPDHYRRFDPETREALARLKETRYAGLRTIPETLDPEAYARIFQGAICVQPYDRDDFADRVSGVMLDALWAGAPVVTPAGTWMARTASRFGAGIAVDSFDPQVLLKAILAIRKDYDRYASHAREAGRVLREEHDPGHLYRVLTG